MLVQKKKSKPAGIWHQRFSKQFNQHALAFTSSVKDDIHLVPYDIAASVAHVRMLRKQRYLTSREEKELVRWLKKIYRRFRTGAFQLKEEYEDVHISIEKELARCAGKVAYKLHTARSRNDLVAADMRLFVRSAVLNILSLIIEIQRKCIRKAKRDFEIIIPAYTHLQRAQPILWSYYLLAFVCRLQRDFSCLQDALKRVNISPLGSCACSGTSHNIDAEYLASLLRFDRSPIHALDGASDRDFLTEIAHDCVQSALHCASFAEDMIIYSTEEFNLIDFDDSMLTGSSIMPHKKNPDVCELIRARSGNTIGNLVSLLTIQKGLPLGYNRDLQETKGIMIRQLTGMTTILEMVALLIPALHVHDTGWQDQRHYCCAVDLVDFLVTHGEEFRTAYHTIAQCVKISRTIDEFVSVCAKKLGMDPQIVAHLLTPSVSVRAKKSKGSTGIESTKKIMREVLKNVSDNKKIIHQLRKKYSLNHLLT